jgi:hypothetical protein
MVRASRFTLVSEEADLAESLKQSGFHHICLPHRGKMSTFGQPAQTEGEKSWIPFHAARCWRGPLPEAS